MENIKCFICGVGEIADHFGNGYHCNFCNTKFYDEPFNWKVLACQVTEKYDEWAKGKQGLFLFHLPPFLYSKLHKDKLALQELKNELLIDFYFQSDPEGICVHR